MKERQTDSRGKVFSLRSEWRYRRRERDFYESDSERHSDGSDRK